MQSQPNEDKAIAVATAKYNNLKKLSELKSEMQNVNVLGKVITIFSKQRKVYSKENTYFYGTISDNTGSMKFTAWKDFNIKPNDYIYVKNASVRIWNNLLKLNFGDFTKIEIKSIEPKLQKIENLHYGTTSGSIIVKILALEEREITVRNEKKKIWKGVVGDETGKIAFTAWIPFLYSEEDVIKINNLYIKYNGRFEITINENTTIEKLTQQITQIPDKIYTISQALNGAVGYIKGTVVEIIQKGSGIIYKCPECKSFILPQSVCVRHGSIEPVKDFRIKLVLDDTTESISVILSRDISEKLLNKDFAEIEKISNEELNALIQKQLLMKELRVFGTTLKTDVYMNFIADYADFEKLDYKSEINL